MGSKPGHSKKFNGDRKGNSHSGPMKKTSARDARVAGPKKSAHKSKLSHKVAPGVKKPGNGTVDKSVYLPAPQKLDKLKTLEVALQQAKKGDSKRSKRAHPFRERREKRQIQRDIKNNVVKASVGENDLDDLDDFLDGLDSGSSANTVDGTPEKVELLPPSAANRKSKRASMEDKFAGSKFRWLNEVLYTSKSKDALDLFKKEPYFFEMYHKGFRQQVTEWSVNPVDHYIEMLETDVYPFVKKDIDGTVKVADMGCGDAKLAQTIDEKGMTDKLEVYSFDLVKEDKKKGKAWSNKYITACDIANTPLDDGVIDICIFSLSLMGTNYLDFIKEAHRILVDPTVGEGQLLISEVISRFPDTDKFVEAIESIGFELESKEQVSKVFLRFKFIKVTQEAYQPSPETDATELLKPCFYKRR